MTYFCMSELGAKVRMTYDIKCASKQSWKNKFPEYPAALRIPMEYDLV